MHGRVLYIKDLPREAIPSAGKVLRELGRVQTPELQIRVWSRSLDLIDSIGWLLLITVGQIPPLQGIQTQIVTKTLNTCNSSREFTYVVMQPRLQSRIMTCHCCFSIAVLLDLKRVLGWSSGFVVELVLIESSAASTAETYRVPVMHGLA